MTRTPRTPSNYVSYYRVSTQKQGESGLGLEAQQAAVARYIEQHKGDLIAEYTEIESGKRSDNRPELAAAIRAAQRARATLIIAKLDRLARNVHFISGLMESNLDFVACDLPKANRLTIHIMAAIAEHEREMISARTKAALAQAKARGTKLGNPQWQAALTKAIAARAKPKPVEEVQEMLIKYRKEGQTFREIADKMNALGIKTPKGAGWWGSSVRHWLPEEWHGKFETEKQAQDKEAKALLVLQRREGKNYREIANNMNALGIKTPTGANWHPSTVRAALLAA